MSGVISKRKELDPEAVAWVRRRSVSAAEAAQLARLFRLLSGATRLRLLHAIGQGEGITVGRLAEAMEMTPQAVSNQLQRLADRGILAARRQGREVHYRIVDAHVLRVVGGAWALVEESAAAGKGRA